MISKIGKIGWVSRAPTPIRRFLTCLNGSRGLRHTSERRTIGMGGLAPETCAAQSSRVVIGLIAPGWSEEVDLEKAKYLSSCASCHGEDGKGKGPFSDKLKTAPPDLTTLAKKNNGVFPAVAVYRSIDGRTLIESHDIREMPIWGCRHTPSAVQGKSLKPDPYESLLDLPCGPEDVIANRILSVLVYLRRIQEK